MKIPYYKAKENNSERIYEGFYFAMPETTYCFSEDYQKSDVKILHFLVAHQMTDWGLPNRPYLVTIDPSTLEQIGEVDSNNEFYYPLKWIEYNKG